MISSPHPQAQSLTQEYGYVGIYSIYVTLIARKLNNRISAVALALFTDDDHTTPECASSCGEKDSLMCAMRGWLMVSRDEIGFMGNGCLCSSRYASMVLAVGSSRWSSVLQQSGDK